jgi:hypothetical protein
LWPTACDTVHCSTKPDRLDILQKKRLKETCFPARTRQTHTRSCLYFPITLIVGLLSHIHRQPDNLIPSLLHYRAQHAGPSPPHPSWGAFFLHVAAFAGIQSLATNHQRSVIPPRVTSCHHISTSCHATWSTPATTPVLGLLGPLAQATRHDTTSASALPLIPQSTPCQVHLDWMSNPTSAAETCQGGISIPRGKKKSSTGCSLEQAICS